MRAAAWCCAMALAASHAALAADQWALTRLEIPPAESSLPPVVVAVVDTGADLLHPGLPAANQWRNKSEVANGVDDDGDGYVDDLIGWNFVAGDNMPWDDCGHGTHVAGIIAAHANNGRGIAGGAPGVKILPVRVLNANGSGSSADVAAGVIWAADHGARVINLSLGGGPSPGMEQAIAYARTKKVVTLAAAGNSYQAGNPPTYPAAYPEAIAVAAIDSTGHHASFSETGTYVDIAAPGDLIWSTYGSGRTQYALMSGTSMATPYASAAAALVVASNPSLDANGVTDALEQGATDIGNPGVDTVYGHGLVNPRGAIAAGSPTRVNRGTQGHGYWVVTANGRVYGYGVRSYGDLAGQPLTSPIMAAARTPSGKGYWLVSAGGQVYSFGDAPYLGSMAGRHLNQPIVGMAAMPNGFGYILLGRDGGIFGFGDAHFYGSTGGMRLNAPVLDMTMTSDGKGYWFVAADGGIFGFGDARFHGSTAKIHLAQPVRSMTASADGKGYWMVASDGGIFGFGVPFQGALPAVRSLYGWPYIPTVRMRSLPNNAGYYLLGVNGTVWAFAAARFFGSAPLSFAVDLMQAP
jgi:hypothetical protein